MFTKYWNKTLLAICVIIVFVAVQICGFYLMSEPSWIKILLGIAMIMLALYVAPKIFSRIFGELHEHKEDE